MPEELKMEDISRLKMEDIPKQVLEEVYKKWVDVLKQAEEINKNNCEYNESWYWNECALCVYVKKHWAEKNYFIYGDGDEKCFYLCPLSVRPVRLNSGQLSNGFYCTGWGIKSLLHYKYHGKKNAWIESIKSFLEFLKPYI